MPFALEAGPRAAIAPIVAPGGPGLAGAEEVDEPHTPLAPGPQRPQDLVPLPRGGGRGGNNTDQVTTPLKQTELEFSADSASF